MDDFKRLKLVEQIEWYFWNKFEKNQLTIDWWNFIQPFCWWKNPKCQIWVLEEFVQNLDEKTKFSWPNIKDLKAQKESEMLKEFKVAPDSSEKRFCITCKKIAEIISGASSKSECDQLLYELFILRKETTNINPVIDIDSQFVQEFLRTRSISPILFPLFADVASIINRRSKENGSLNFEIYKTVKNRLFS